MTPSQDRLMGPMAQRTRYHDTGEFASGAQTHFMSGVSVGTDRVQNSVDWRGRPIAVMLTALSIIWTTLLITNAGFNLIGTEKLGLVYNDMARRLLNLDATIDPNLIAFEAFVRDGRTYTYFGILPALLRIPAVLAGFGSNTLSRPSCIIALAIVTFATIRMTQCVLAARLQTPAARRLAVAAILGVCFSGPGVYLLASASIYHEAIFWSVAFSAWFNCLAISAAARGALTAGTFVRLACLAGCALLTRVTAGISLTLGLALLAFWPAALSCGGADKRSLHLAVGTVFNQTWAATIVLVGFVVSQMAVNDSRWHDPFVTVPLRYYAQLATMPDHERVLAVLARHGAVDLVRAPLAVVYYALGLDIKHVFPDTYLQHFMGIEGPRSLTLLCSPWVIVSAALGAGRISSWRRMPAPIQALLSAQAVALILMLSIPWLCLRYTFDGWSFMTLASAWGTRMLLAEANACLNLSSRRWEYVSKIAVAAMLLGVVASHATLLRYKINYSGTTPTVRYWLSRELQPLLCPNATINAAVQLTDFIPLVTTACPPLW